MKDLWNRIDSWLEANAPSLLSQLQPGATEAAIQKAEAFLGVEFPEDVKASYRIHNGQSGGSNLIYAWELLSLERTLEEWQVWQELFAQGEFEFSESQPRGPIRTYWWNPFWIPLTDNGAGDHHCLDLDPAPGGEVGQIIAVWHNYPDRYVIANSFQTWLEKFADDLQAGKYIFADGSLEDANSQEPAIGFFGY